jgi:SulP family sulfate permease
LPKVKALWAAIDTVQWQTVAIALFSIGVIAVIRKLRPTWPFFLIAVGFAAAVAYILHLDVATVGSRFGALPNTLPSPSLPTFSVEKVQAVLPDAFAIAILGAIESLLSAVVADGMSGARHRSNCELAAQGVANIASVIFGGICVTGTIARTATNIRAGARGPLAGIFHCVYLLVFLMIAGSLVAYIPLAALGAVLVTVAWRMAEKDEFWSLLRGSRGDAVVLLATFLLTIFVDLITGIGVGVVLGALLFLHRMAEAIEVEGGPDLVPQDAADSARDKTEFDAAQAMSHNVLVYRITGAFFFGATARVSLILARLAVHPKVFVLDFRDVPLIDSTAAHSLAGFTARLRRSGTVVYFAATRLSVRKVLMRSGLSAPDVHYVASVDDVKTPE